MILNTLLNTLYSYFGIHKVLFETGNAVNQYTVLRQLPVVWKNYIFVGIWLAAWWNIHERAKVKILCLVIFSVIQGFTCLVSDTPWSKPKALLFTDAYSYPFEMLFTMPLYSLHQTDLYLIHIHLLRKLSTMFSTILKHYIAML